jgi:xylan 1,4-beta-xylosidase
MSQIHSCPRNEVTVDGGTQLGPLEAWRLSVGHGGINWKPLSPRVAAGIAQLRPRLVRVFLQEFFAVLPAPGRLDWTRLDPYLDSFARTGATIVAAICLKPPPLYPRIDQTLWRPSDPEAWQALIRALVRRYSVDRRLVSHWEVGNETDIGESGGSPYLVPDPDDYLEFYRMTIQAVLEAWPQAKVGGPAACWVANQPLPGLVERCRRTGTQLDFVSWHLYSDDAARHADGVRQAQQLLAGFPGPRPLLFVTEWSKGFEPVSVEDLACAPRRASTIAASALGLLEARVDCGFYYHIQDQTFYREDFAPFYSPQGLDLMHVHWNEIPHRFGLFGVDGEVRPQYFVFRLLAAMAPERLAARSDCADVRVLASGGEDVTVLLVNHNPQTATDRVVSVRCSGLPAGRKLLTTWRLDAERRWDEAALELQPRERREVDTASTYRAQVYLPADSVLLLRLAPLTDPG